MNAMNILTWSSNGHLLEDLEQLPDFLHALEELQCHLVKSDFLTVSSTKM